MEVRDGAPQGAAKAGKVADCAGVYNLTHCVVSRALMEDVNGGGHRHSVIRGIQGASKWNVIADGWTIWCVCATGEADIQKAMSGGPRVELVEVVGGEQEVSQRVEVELAQPRAAWDRRQNNVSTAWRQFRRDGVRSGRGRQRALYIEGQTFWLTTAVGP